MYLPTSRDRELIEIIRELRDQGLDATYSQISENIQSFRAGDYVIKMLRRLKNEGYILKTDRGYDIVEEVKLTEEELIQIPDREFLSLTEISDAAYVILGLARHRPKNLPDVRREILQEISSDTIRENFLFWALLFRLYKSTALIPKITVRADSRVAGMEEVRLPEGYTRPTSLETMVATKTEKEPVEDKPEPQPNPHDKGWIIVPGGNIAWVGADSERYLEYMKKNNYYDKEDN
jgi:biotin operon repressor